MQDSIEEFLDYMENVRKVSQNTKQSYRRDLVKMIKFMEKYGIDDVSDITVTNINAYILNLEKNGMSPATISRNIASMKAYFHYLMVNRKIENEPVEFVKAPPVEKKAPHILSVEEVDRLLAQPAGNTPKTVRDRAMIELLYATGMRVSEMIVLKVSDVNLEMDYVSCAGKGKKNRIVPFGRAAKDALTVYIMDYRDNMVKEKNNDLLFVNCQGNPMSRQGFWKIIKGYGVKADIQTDITPHSIRHSFAAHMVANGADLKSVQELMGLSDISSTKIYADVSRKRLRSVYESTHPRK